MMSEELKISYRRRGNVSGDGIVLDEGADHHQRAGEGASKADAHLVEDKPREEEHQQEDVDETAGT